MVDYGPAPNVDDVITLLTTRELSALKGITDEMAKQIMQELTEGILAGEGVSKLAERITERVDKIGISRAATMAHYETMLAFHEAAKDRYNAWGVERVEWLCGGGPCDICAPLCGQKYDFGSEPDIPQHIGCVCDIAPVSKYMED